MTTLTQAVRPRRRNMNRHGDSASRGGRGSKPQGKRQRSERQRERQHSERQRPERQRPARPGPSRPAPANRRGGRRRKAGPEERLHKYIANCGYCSRRRAELLIDRGLVQVNGEVVTGTGIVIDPTNDKVTINNEKILPPEPLTIALNKPRGYLTSTLDTHDRLTVMDLLPKKLVDSGLLPAGRLDFETEGLLILTNDGDLQHRVTHPRFQCVKEYRVTINRPLTDNDKRRLTRGIYLREFGKKTSEAVVDQERKNRDGTASCHIRIGEGMKRQVRRMFKALGCEVTHLERVAIGTYKLGQIPRGEWRRLRPDDLAALVRKPKEWPAAMARRR